MALFDTSRTTYGSATIGARILGFITASMASVVAWNDARVTRNALSCLTDRELADIGLSRSDIDGVAQSNLIR